MQTSYAASLWIILQIGICMEQYDDQNQYFLQIHTSMKSMNHYVKAMIFFLQVKNVFLLLT